MSTVKDILKVLDMMSYDTVGADENSKLIDIIKSEDEDIINQVLNVIQMELEIEFPLDDAFYRFAPYMPLKELEYVANNALEDPVF